jgi:hypothetical protein
MLQSDSHRVKSSRGRKGPDPFDPPESVLDTNWLAAYNQFKAKQLVHKKGNFNARGGGRGSRGAPRGRGFGPPRGRGGGWNNGPPQRGGWNGPPRGGWNQGYNQGGGSWGGHHGGKYRLY